SAVSRRDAEPREGIEPRRDPDDEPSSWTGWFARWLLGAPTRWLGRSSAVAQDITGGTDGLKYLRHLARGNRIRRTSTFENVDQSSPPVLLIHGFMGTRGSMYPLEQRFVD